MLIPGYRTVPAGHELTLTRDYRQPVEKLWAAFTIPETFAAWMGCDWEGDAEVTLGSNYSYRFRGPGLLADGRVTVFEPMRVLEHTWFESSPEGAATIRWTFSPQGSGTRLTLTHTQAAPDDLARTAAGWTDLLAALGRSFGDPADADPVPWPRLRRAMRGLLPASVVRDAVVSRRADGGYTLTYDRRLAHPVDKVWTAVTSEAGVSAWMIAEATIEPRVGGRYRLAFRGMSHVWTAWSLPGSRPGASPTPGRRRRRGVTRTWPSTSHRMGRAAAG